MNSFPAPRGTRRRGTTALALILFAAISSLAQTDVRQIAGRVDAHYNHLQTLQAEFIETYRGPGVNRTESGTLWLKRPGRMRWEYRQPHEKLFLTDGKTVWFYVPGEKQARRTRLKTLEDLRSPLAYLLGKTKLEKEFAGLSVAPDIKPEIPGDVVLRGIPRHLGGISQVQLEITPDSRIARILVEQEDGSSTEFRFDSQKENAAISDQRFKFAPPPGVETIESEQLGQ